MPFARARVHRPILAAIRDGFSRDARPLMPPMGFAYCKNISEPDMAALIACLRTLPATEQRLQPSSNAFSSMSLMA